MEGTGAPRAARGRIRARWVAALLALGVLVTVAWVGSGWWYPPLPQPVDGAPRAVTAEPTRWVLPTTLPVGMVAAGVTRSRSPALYASTVYVDPRRTDPFAGPLLAAIGWGGSDIDEPPGRAGAGRRIRVAGHMARLSRAGGYLWIWWDEWIYSGQEPPAYGVVGRGVSEATLIRAARHLLGGRGSTPRIARAGLPGGLRPVAAGASAVPGDYRGLALPHTTTMRWVSGGRELWINITRGNRAAVNLARFAASGWLGATPDQPPPEPIAGGRTARTWADGDLIIQVYTVGLFPQEIDAVTAGLEFTDHPPQPTTR